MLPWWKGIERLDQGFISISVFWAVPLPFLRDSPRQSSRTPSSRTYWRKGSDDDAWEKEVVTVLDNGSPGVDKMLVVEHPTPWRRLTQEELQTDMEIGFREPLERCEWKRLQLVTSLQTFAESLVSWVKVVYCLYCSHPLFL